MYIKKIFCFTNHIKISKEKINSTTNFSRIYLGGRMPVKWIDNYGHFFAFTFSGLLNKKVKSKSRVICGNKQRYIKRSTTIVGPNKATSSLRLFQAQIPNFYKGKKKEKEKRVLWILGFAEIFN